MLLKDRILGVIGERKLELYAEMSDEVKAAAVRELAGAIVKEFQAFVRDADVEG
jgi:hypothetical protein